MSAQSYEDEFKAVLLARQAAAASGIRTAFVDIPDHVPVPEFSEWPERAPWLIVRNASGGGWEQDRAARSLVKYGFFVVDNWLEDQDTLTGLPRLLQYLRHQLGVAGVGNQKAGEEGRPANTVRGDSVTFLYPRKVQKDYRNEPELLYVINRLLASFERVRAMVRGIIGADIDNDPEIQVAVYPPNSIGYEMHSDAAPVLERHVKDFGVDPFYQRIVTCVYYANENWQPKDEGCLRVWRLGTAMRNGQRRKVYIDVPPKPNRLICFLSARIPHAVLTNNAKRSAITAWHWGNAPSCQEAFNGFAAELRNSTTGPTSPTTPTGSPSLD